MVTDQVPLTSGNKAKLVKNYNAQAIPVKMEGEKFLISFQFILHRFYPLESASY